MFIFSYQNICFNTECNNHHAQLDYFSINAVDIRSDNIVHKLNTVCLLLQHSESCLVCTQVVKRFGKKLRQKSPEIFASKSWINTPLHMALSVIEFLAGEK